jgi:hypothetical protein
VFVLRLGGFLLSSDNDRCAEGGALRGVFGPVRFRHLAWRRHRLHHQGLAG